MSNSIFKPGHQNILTYFSTIMSDRLADFKTDFIGNVASKFDVFSFCSHQLKSRNRFLRLDSVLKPFVLFDFILGCLKGNENQRLIGKLKKNRRKIEWDCSEQSKIIIYFFTY